jgi:aryl-alcohol dehydrogenase-like predicted oxidoreductase
MKQRAFGSSGVNVSEIGLGCWQLGGADWGDMSEEDALATLQAAVESGVNFFDTADVYGLGRSESIIGKFLKDCPEEVFVATKLGRFPEPGWPDNFTLDTFRDHTTASLRRLGVEALDLTQLHCIPTDVLKRGEVFEWLRTLQQEGKIKRFGASVETMDEALFCLQQDGITSLQIIFNIFRQKPITTIFDQAKEKGIALIVRLPLASGLLTGKFNKTTYFPENDHRNYNRDGQSFNVGETFAGLMFEKGVELADSLKPMVPSRLTMTQMALRWCLDYDAISVVIPGAKTPQQAAANAAVSELPPLSDQEHQRVKVFYETEVVAHIRGSY